MCSHWAFGAKMTSYQRRRRIDVDTTSFLRHVPAGVSDILLPKSRARSWVISEAICLNPTKPTEEEKAVFILFPVLRLFCLL